MRTLTAFARSLPSLVVRPRLVAALYVGQLLLAGVVLLPLTRAFEKTFGQSVAGLRASEGLHLESTWQDFRLWNKELLGAAEQTFSGVALVALFLAFTLLSGATFAALAARPRDDSLRALLAGAGRCFGRFLRLLPLHVAGLVGVALLNHGLTVATNRLAAGPLENAAPSRYVGLLLHAKTLYVLWLLAWVVAVSGLAKARLVDREERSAFKAWCGSWLLVLRKPLAGALLGGLGPLMIAGTIGLYALARDQLPAGATTILLEQRVPTWAALLVLSQLLALLQQATGVVWAETFLRFERATRDARLLASLPDVRAARRTVAAAGLLVVALAAGSAAYGQESSSLPLGPFPQNYVLDVELLPESHVVRGTVRVRFTNTGTKPVGELLFHLYPNAFSGPGTLWMRERRLRLGKDPLAESTADAFGRCDVTRVADETGAALAFQVDETVLHVTPSRPVAPGAAATVSLQFATRLPAATLSGRGGWHGRHYDGMQWYPKLGVLRDGAFDCEPFHADTEFFAEFADYDVTFTLPGSFVFGATGTRTSATDAPPLPGTNEPARRYRQVARAVHDFAWCADPAFTLFSDEVRFADGRRVPIDYYCQPYGKEKAPLVLWTTKRCLELYADWFEPYPYDRITVDGVPMGLAGGMEYPMLFTISQAFPNHLPPLVDLTESPSGVTAHEFGHQYWYGILANDEFREAWLDEGVNTYVTTKIQEQLFPHRPGRALQAAEWSEVVEPFLDTGLTLDCFGQELALHQLVGFKRSPFTTSRRGTRGDPTLLGFRVALDRLPGAHGDRFLGRRNAFVPIAASCALRDVSYALYPTAYSAMVYGKTTLALGTLERIYGWDAVREALREYVRRHRFTHPTGSDFLAILSEVVPKVSPGTGIPIEPLLREMWETAHALDLAVTTARSYAIDAGDSRRPKRWRSEVIVENRGTAMLPAEIQLHYENGEEDAEEDGENGEAGRDEWIAWPADRRFLVIEREGGSRLAWAAVDPTHKLLLDTDWTNNGRTVARNADTMRKLETAALWWIESGLALLRTVMGP